MDELPFDLEPGEALIVTEETPIVPDNRSPAPGRFWLTTQRIAARWTEGGGLLRAAAPRTLTLRLTDVTETRAPGGPLVQVIARDGTRLSLQSFRVLSLRQQIAEAVAEASKAPQATPVSMPDASAETTLSSPIPITHGEQSRSTAAASDLLLCPRCNSKVATESRFCPHCGVLLRAQVAYCRRCDQDYPAHHRYCARCGETLITSEFQPPRRR